MPTELSQSEFIPLRTREYDKWDKLLDQRKISAKDWLRHINEFEEMYPKETARYKAELWKHLPSEYRPTSGSLNIPSAQSIVNERTR